MRSIPSTSVIRTYCSSVPSGNVYNGSGTCGNPGSNTWKWASHAWAGIMKSGRVFVSADRIGVVCSMSLMSPVPVSTRLWVPLAERLGPRCGASEQQVRVGPGQLERTDAEGLQAGQHVQVRDPAHHQQLPVPPAGVSRPGPRVADSGVVVAPGYSQLSGEVVSSDGQDVHLVELRDRVSAGDAVGCLEQDRHDRGVVEGRVELYRGSGPHAELRHHRKLRALAPRSEPAGPANRPGLVHGLDPRCDDALCPAVEQPPDRAVLTLRHAGERCQAEIARGRAELGGHVGRHIRGLEVC